LKNKINIVSFDVPYPPNYGGVIDVYYKIISLKRAGIKIYLHTFEYGRGEQIELEKFCEKVYYYKRKSSLKNIFSKIPFVVKSRDSNKLIQNLLANNYPILFEGLHSTFPLLKHKFISRNVILRAHNIEHYYYKGLAKSEPNLFKKLFFITEAIKLKYYESILNKVDTILPISHLEQKYFASKFPKKSKYVAAFHPNEKINSSIGIGNFALYHGDLRVPDNIKSCYYLIKIFSKIKYPLIIASNFKNNNLIKEINKHSNIDFKHCNTNKEIDKLLKNAHISVLPTFQNTGIKLKLINALYNGRFCIVNNEMIVGTSLENICEIANSEKEFISLINHLSTEKFTNQKILNREKILSNFDNQKSAQKILELLIC